MSLTKYRIPTCKEWGILSLKKQAIAKIILCTSLTGGIVTNITANGCVNWYSYYIDFR